MEFVNIHTFLIVCPLVFLSGLVDAVAGGGGLISLPAYLLAGVPMHHALATNKLSSAIGTSVSTIRYCRNRFADPVTAVPSILAALCGSALGTGLALRTDEKVLKSVMLFVLPVVAFYVLRRKDLEGNTARKRSRGISIALAAAASFVIGGYDGFYGPGTGTFLLLVYTGLVGMDVRTASGNTKLVNLSSNVAALVTWIINGKILAVLGLTAAVFCMAGHYVGSGMVMHRGTKIVKPVILVVLALLFLKILSGQ
ncbi:MAG: TSUP family transporter [Lachnospiraceae bacterium]|nr:TSUP family transporter [Lachnospiraceae bacterium]